MSDSPGSEVAPPPGQPVGPLRCAVVQDGADGRVLMVAWMDQTALAATLRTGLATFWSRSRQRLWQKGETSGNTLAVIDVRSDCDGDALLVRVNATGPACHTGLRSCFDAGDDVRAAVGSGIEVGGSG